MAITTRAQLVAAMKFAQKPSIGRVGNGANAGNLWISTFGVASNNALGVLAGTSTTQGVVPDDTTPGCPSLDSFNGQTGYLAQVEVTPGLIGGLKVRTYDLLFKSGAHAFNATDTLAAQPSYAARLPGTDYTQTELWIENVTAFTGSASIVITYTNESGVTGRTAIATVISSPLAGLATRVALQAGDLGVQKVESVTSTVATVGTFNVLVLRPLTGGLKVAGEAHGAGVAVFGPDLTGMPVVFDTSALYYLLSQDAAGSVLPHEVKFVVVRG